MRARGRRAREFFEARSSAERARNAFERAHLKKKNIRARTPLGICACFVKQSLLFVEFHYLNVQLYRTLHQYTSTNVW